MYSKKNMGISDLNKENSIQPNKSNLKTNVDHVLFNKSENTKKKRGSKTLIVFILLFLGFNFFIDFVNSSVENFLDKKSFIILSTVENKDMEDNIIDFGKKNKIDIEFRYAEDLDAVSLINNGGEYDAIWASNSLWLYQIEEYSLKNSKSISINPTVVAVKKSKAKQLGFVDKNITNKDIIDAISSGKIKYVMSSVVKSNSGASSYLGFLNNLAGSPEVLRSEMLEDEKLKQKMVSLFSGVERVSGTETFLEDMFLNSNDYEAVIAAETSLIRINNELISRGKEPLYLLYPTDGVALSDSPFAYIDRGQDKLEYFDIIQKYLLSEEMQKALENAGRRTWYGGINKNANNKVFNKEWGIDTTKYLIPQKYPSKKVIKEATNLYIEEFRKPSHTIFLLDYSGSMVGTGNNQLVEAMKYILTYEEASKDYIQFSEKDKITVIPFTGGIDDVWTASSGKNTQSLIKLITDKYPSGGTNIYLPSIKALNLLEAEDDKYSKTIVLMTDGNSVDYYYQLKNHYSYKYSKIPIYSIMFGDASSSQLNQIANLTNAKVFDGRTNLLQAFKEVRSFS